MESRWARTFVAVEDEEFKQAETAGGYAKEMSDAYKAKQAALIAETIKKQDIVITTALIPGRPAPVLVTADMVKSMKPGSVIVDLAVEAGGNCAAEPAAARSWSSTACASSGTRTCRAAWPPTPARCIARNLFNLLQPMIDKESKALKINWDDEIVKGICITRDGAVVHPARDAPARGG